uniref:Uncharacterized protein n=1 Tax=Oryza brachyantha TaxID=4533 RepID=J3MUE4_ORYBR
MIQLGLDDERSSLSLPTPGLQFLQNSARGLKNRRNCKFTLVLETTRIMKHGRNDGQKMS